MEKSNEISSSVTKNNRVLFRDVKYQYYAVCCGK